MGEFICIHDKEIIEQTLRGNPALHVYSLGDLDDFFWPKTQWYGWREDGVIQAIALLYLGQDLPAFLAFTESLEPMTALLEHLRTRLPYRFYCHLTLGLEPVFDNDWQLKPGGLHRKMRLASRDLLDIQDCNAAEALLPKHEAEILSFFEESYPGNWFDPRMLETGQYFGVRDKGKLVSLAGIHVYSPVSKVAALGNIATHPDYRRRGYGRQCTARLCQSLLETVDVIGLNVKADNAGAIHCYESLGFEIHASYNEFFVEHQS
ncbi:MAG: GNAT family N-acetyltransferase [Planctomycetota bacterium]|nr:GNAT family N-acetyltransferase [Planctomycetota bacterium]